jgi:HAD superfamily hydrolase (TIGR01490 family)
MKLAIFDCDGTLFSAQFGRGLLAYSWARGQRSQVFRYYLRMLAPYLLRRVNLIDRVGFNRPAIGSLSNLIKGTSVEQAKAAFEWVTFEYLLPTRHPQVIDRLRQHQASAHRIILLSGIFEPSLQLLGSHFGVQDVIGTKLEVRDGRYTGGIVPPIIIGRNKYLALEEFCNSQAVTVDWAGSYAYADSVYDSEILGAVGHATAVQPDPDLKALAIRNGWNVLAEGAQPPPSNKVQQ